MPEKAVVDLQTQGLLAGWNRASRLEIKWFERRWSTVGHDAKGAKVSRCRRNGAIGFAFVADKHPTAALAPRNHHLCRITSFWRLELQAQRT
jgi:hypothetical protein